MGVLIESGEDRLPEDVAALDSELRLDYTKAIEEMPRIAAMPNFLNVADTSFKLADGERKNEDVLLRPPTEPHITPKLKLERWLVEAHAYQDQRAASVGILA